MAVASVVWIAGAMLTLLGVYSALVPDVRDEGGFGIALFILPVAVVIFVIGSLVAKPGRSRTVWSRGLTAVAAIIALLALMLELAPSLRGNGGWVIGPVLLALAIIPGYFALRLSTSPPSPIDDVDEAV